MTRRTVFAGSASGRRRERRADLQSEQAKSSEVMHRPTAGRVVLSCNRKPIDRVSKAVDTSTEYHKQILAAAAKYVECRENPKYRKVLNEAGRTINAKQKMRGKSIPLI
ncbi:antitermination protein [Erwinia tracheiphila]|uniref:transcriptional antitermination N peptide n=1 Tax=Erwinia tracheiphila TaxID=65700 RepID=UPI001F33FA87|nr:antitermination protein [Erwinia tracheiphila]UIA85252.1 antitermination protein [Erwinia tracheiphila]